MCRKAGSFFCLSWSFGMCGLAFFDLGETFEYKKKNANGEEIVEEETYESLDIVIEKDFTAQSYYKTGRKAFDSSFFAFLKRLDVKLNLSQVAEPLMVSKLEENLKDGVEIAPVCAVLGGIVAQEIIKVMARNGKPINNMFFFDTNRSRGVVKKI